MIVRMWHGRVSTEKAAVYWGFLNQRAIPDCRSVAGNGSVCLLDRPEGAVTHFVTLAFGTNWEAVWAFAGEEVEQAKYYPEDRHFLLEFEPTVVHYEVVGMKAPQALLCAASGAEEGRS